MNECYHFVYFEFLVLYVFLQFTFHFVLLIVQEKLLARRHELQKQSAFNLGVAEANAMKKLAKDEFQVGRKGGRVGFN